MGGQIAMVLADNDPLRVSWTRADTGLSSHWLFGWMLNSVFPNVGGSSVSFAAPSLARTAIIEYDASVADGREDRLSAVTT